MNTVPRRRLSVLVRVTRVAGEGWLR